MSESTHNDGEGHYFPGAGALDRALSLVRFLRRECPWDQAQTAESLIPYLLEETHEVVDAIREGSAAQLEGELGDLLLNLAFQIVVAEENQTLDADSVYGRLEAKMIRRHPHIFGDGEKQEWEKLKAAERGQFDLMACWAVDRLGRSMVTAANAMDTLERAGVDQYYHQNGGDVIDGSTPMGKAMIGMSVVFAELERAQIVSRIQAGLDRARAEGKRLGRKPGWRPEKRKAQDEILALHRAGVSVRKIAKTVSVAPGTVQKVVSEHRRA